MRIQNKNILKIIYILAFLLLLIIINILSFVSKDTETSFSENRTMSQFMFPTYDAIISGEWFTQFESYCKDQIICREELITLYYKLLDTLQVYERNGFVLGTDSYILPVNEYLSASSLKSCKNYGEQQVSTMSYIKQVTEENNGKLIYVNIPKKEDIYCEKYPCFYNNDSYKNAITRESIITKAKAAGIDTVETYDVLFSKKDEYIYYATNHHFTIKGAYYVYLALLQEINKSEKEQLSFPSWEDLDVIQNKSRMAGTYLRSWGDSHTISVDYMEYALPYDFPEYTRCDNGVETESPLYLPKSSNYTSFMCGDIGNTVVETNREDLPSILYIGFSFTNALEVLSIYNFNKMESIDPRHCEINICEYIQESKPDYVIIVRDDIYEGNPQFTCTVR